MKQGINGIPTLFMKPVRNSGLFLWKYQMIFFLMPLLKKKDIRCVELDMFLVLTIMVESYMWYLLLRAIIMSIYG